MPVDILYRRTSTSDRSHSFSSYGSAAQRFVTALVRAGFIVSVFDAEPHLGCLDKGP